MGICIYCDKEKKLTKEHVFPDFIEKKSESRGLYYSASAEKYVPNAPVVKDVCKECNNIKLSKLDSYASELYEKYFKYEISSTTTIKIDRDKLIRWLLKVLFNAQRSFKGPHRIFIPYKEYMLDAKAPPREIFLFGGVMKGSMHLGSYVEAKDIRVSDVRIPELKLGIQHSLCHVVTIRSYSFLLLSFLKKPSKKAFERTVKFIRKNTGYELCSSDTEIRFNPSVSKMDHVKHKGHQKYHNPSVYPNNGIVSVGKEKLKLTNFPETPDPRVKVVDSKLSLISISDNERIFPLIGRKSIDNALEDFSANLSSDIDQQPDSNRAQATVLRKGDKTYVTVHDLLEPGVPFSNPTTGIHQSKENWNLWKKGLEENGCIYLCTGAESKNVDDVTVHAKVRVVDIKEED